MVTINIFVVLSLFFMSIGAMSLSYADVYAAPKPIHDNYTITIETGIITSLINPTNSVDIELLNMTSTYTVPTTRPDLILVEKPILSFASKSIDGEKITIMSNQIKGKTVGGEKSDLATITLILDSNENWSGTYAGKIFLDDTKSINYQVIIKPNPIELLGFNIVGIIAGISGNYFKKNNKKPKGQTTQTYSLFQVKIKDERKEATKRVGEEKAFLIIGTIISLPTVILLNIFLIGHPGFDLAIAILAGLTIYFRIIKKI